MYYLPALGKVTWHKMTYTHPVTGATVKVLVTYASGRGGAYLARVSQRKALPDGWRTGQSLYIPEVNLSERD